MAERFPPIRDSVSDAHLVAIGTLAGEWQYLEWHVDIAIGTLLKLNFGLQEVVTTHIRIKEKLEILKALVDQLLRDLDDDQIIDELNQQASGIERDITKLQSKRNDIIHGRWLSGGKEVQRAKVTARGKLRFEIKPVSVNEIEETISDVRSIHQRLEKLYMHPAFWQGASP